MTERPCCCIAHKSSCDCDTKSFGIPAEMEPHYAEFQRYRRAVDVWPKRNEVVTGKAYTWLEWWEQKFGRGETLYAYVARFKDQRPESIEIVRRFEREDLARLRADHSGAADPHSVGQGTDSPKSDVRQIRCDTPGGSREALYRQPGEAFFTPTISGSADPPITNAAERERHRERIQRLRDIVAGKK